MRFFMILSVIACCFFSIHAEEFFTVDIDSGYLEISQDYSNNDEFTIWEKPFTVEPRQGSITGQIKNFTTIKVFYVGRYWKISLEQFKKYDSLEIAYCRHKYAVIGENEGAELHSMLTLSTMQQSWRNPN